MTISPKGRSRVIVVEFTSENPSTAAEIANTHADLYIIEQLEVKFEATRRATAWLNERVAGLRDKVRETERAAETFRQKSGLLEGRGEGVTLTSQELSELTTQLILARTARAEAGARLQQVRELVSSASSVDSAAEVLESLLIQRLREQEAEVERKVAELSVEYGERHPTMINARAEVRDLRNKIQTEVNKIVKGLENEVGVMRVREATLRASLEDMKKRAAKANKASIQLRALEREATANRTLLETFLARFKETSAQEDLNAQTADARIISLAEVPDKPSFPKKRLMIALAFVGSTIIGLMLVFTIEQLDAGFRSGEQIERVTGVPVLGLVPILSGLGRIGTSPETYIVEHPTSAFGESIRTLHTSILLSRVDDPPKSILITSSLPKEGKTVIAACLARLRGKAGQKVVVVDADMRHPNIHRVFGVPLQPGLTELLAGEATFEEVVRKDEATGAHVIAAGRPVPNPPDLLASEQMKRFLGALTKAYDLVVFDSPPVVAVSDARILSNAVDMTVFVVRWADTRREVVGQGLKQIAMSGGHLAGVVLSLVNAKKHARYGYGDSGYYYGRVKKYYTS
jgi:capsular exopolysaccharide synthesis family protein